MKLIGKVKELTSEPFTSKDNTPFMKYVLTLVYNAEVYSAKKKDTYVFPKEIIFEVITTNYQRAGEWLPFTNDISDRLYNIQQSMGEEPTYVGVDFFISSEAKEIAKRDGGTFIKIENKLKINHVYNHGNEPDADFVEEEPQLKDIPQMPVEDDDLPF